MIFLNAEKFLGEAVHSVLNQSYESVELLLCDDGSTDDVIQARCATWRILVTPAAA
jgi:glycosyltransferase involved in cell wall biosynthesis